MPITRIGLQYPACLLWGVPHWPVEDRVRQGLISLRQTNANHRWTHFNLSFSDDLWAWKALEGHPDGTDHRLIRDWISTQFAIFVGSMASYAANRIKPIS